MAVELDFPPNPTLYQVYIAPSGVNYQWNGNAWVVGFYDATTDYFNAIGDLLDQIRVLLQDTDTLSGYRYSTDSIIKNINMGMFEMYRMRPDIFIETGYTVPQFDSGNLAVQWPLEQQWIPSIVYYAVGMAQMRDEEGTQDQRASAFVTKFTSTLLSLS